MIDYEKVCPFVSGPFNGCMFDKCIFYLEDDGICAINSIARNFNNMKPKNSFIEYSKLRAVEIGG